RGPEAARAGSGGVSAGGAPRGGRARLPLTGVRCRAPPLPDPRPRELAAHIPHPARRLHRPIRAGSPPAITYRQSGRTVDMTIACAHCGTEPTSRRQGIPWCDHCGIWLVRDERTAQWTSFAEHAHRQPRYGQRKGTARTGDAATAAQPVADALLPAGWHSSLAEPSHGGCSTLDLHPSAGPVDAYAYLVPPIGGHDWRVRVYHRTTGV